jgi:hypothetical protein
MAAKLARDTVEIDRLRPTPLTDYAKEAQAQGDKATADKDAAAQKVYAMEEAKMLAAIKRHEEENANLLKQPLPKSAMRYGPVLNQIAEYLYGCAQLSRDREHHVCILFTTEDVGGTKANMEGKWHTLLQAHITALAARRVFVQVAVLGVATANLNGDAVAAMSSLTFDEGLRLVECVPAVAPPLSPAAEAAAIAAATDAASPYGARLRRWVFVLETCY